MFSPSLLWTPPRVNPINKKALSIPLLNPLTVYGRVFFFAWFAFMIAFLSWYAFPPLLKDVIAKDIDISADQIAISNIIALLATLLVRLVAGTACDRFGPRWTFAACLYLGAIPTFLTGTVYSFGQLCAVRFFIGILGGSFVPCQVWTTGFFDNNIVGTANSLTAGFGNAGGGITYFVMPAVFNALVSGGLSESVSWRVSFVVPGILIVVVATLLLLLCPDTPTGKWSERAKAAEQNRRELNGSSRIVDIPADTSTSSPSNLSDDEEKKDSRHEKEGEVDDQEDVDHALGQVIHKPSWKESMKVVFSPSTIVLGLCYACTFGAELSINSILGDYFGENISGLSLSGSGSWAAMFGLLNVVFRPLGGFISDYAFRITKTLWAKKLLLHTYCILTGAFLVALGKTDPHNLAMMVGLMNVGAAFFLEGANGLNFALVPHVHPYANGIVSGVTGAFGNLGGIMFALVFKYVGVYSESIWIVGIVVMVINVAIMWIPPVPKSQK